MLLLRVLRKHLLNESREVGERLWHKYWTYCWHYLAVRQWGTGCGVKRDKMNVCVCFFSPNHLSLWNLSFEHCSERAFCGQCPNILSDLLCCLSSSQDLIACQLCCPKLMTSTKQGAGWWPSFSLIPEQLWEPKSVFICAFKLLTLIANSSESLFHDHCMWRQVSFLVT